MEMDVVQAVAHHAETVMGKEGFRHVSEVVASCKMLALELEAQETDAEAIHMNVLVCAGYLHDISTPIQGYQDHHLKSAELAVEFLHTLDVPSDDIDRVEEAILAHTTRVSLDQSQTLSLEGRILYDASNLGHLSGLAVVTALVEFGARYRERYRNQEINGEILAAVLRHVEERFIELFQSLYTAPARQMAQEKFGRTLAFIDGVIEHLSDSTPV